jgi:hypothetical protein
MGPQQQGYRGTPAGIQHIEAKNGAFTEWEEKRVNALHQILGAEPPLRDLLVNLDVR